MSNYQKVINEYINALKEKEVHKQNEHTGRTPLENLLDLFAKSRDIQVVHEPKRDEKGLGSPDFKFKLKGSLIGSLENKKIGENLDKILTGKQIAKYKKDTNNLILTDYLRWIWIKDEQIIIDFILCDSSLLNENSPISLNIEEINKLETLLINFFEVNPNPIIKSNDLSQKLSNPTRDLKNEIKVLLEKENPSILDLYKAIKQELSENINTDEFSDMVAQTFTYSLFLTRLYLGNKEILTIDNIRRLTPQSFGLIRNIIKKLTDIDEMHDREKKVNLVFAIDRILTFINSTEPKKILEDLQPSKQEYKDPYIHFYEDFLNNYDPQKRKDLGVWYTPQPVVQAIVRNVDLLLKEKFFKEEGLADKDLKLLDFACGTGTFLLEVYDLIFSKIPKGNLKRKDLITNHLLKNLYGFEILMPAYAVAHLKLTERLKDEQYELSSEERIPVYFTNSLEDQTRQVKQIALDSSYEEIKIEGKLAHEIKESREILVIMGNPPYNGKSQNNFRDINNLIQVYKPKDEIKEQKNNGTNDDYVKFIRFAEDKIEKSGQGIVGIITNHGFLDNPTFRAMRQHLMKTFEQIYVIDLHGGSRKEGKSHNSYLDQNVFDIQTGVAISFFVKKEGLKKGIFHRDIYGTRESKFKQLKELDLDLDSFTKVEPTKPFDLFIPVNTSLEEEYKKGINLRDIFRERSSGVFTQRDKVAMQFSKNEIENVIRDIHDLDENEIVKKFNTTKWTSRDAKVEFCKKDIVETGIKEELFTQCHYRPFDFRWTYYTGKSQGFMTQPAKNIMSHILKHKNIGLCFMRNEQGISSYQHVFVTDKLIELHLFSSVSGANISPLYLYQDNLFEQGEVSNFKPEFLSHIENSFGGGG